MAMGEVGCLTGLRLLWFLGCSSRRCTACQWHYRVTSQGGSYDARITCLKRCMLVSSHASCSGDEYSPQLSWLGVHHRGQDREQAWSRGRWFRFDGLSRIAANARPVHLHVPFVHAVHPLLDSPIELLKLYGTVQK